MKLSMRIIGIDPGYGRMGYGLVEKKAVTGHMWLRLYRNFGKGRIFRKTFTDS